MQSSGIFASLHRFVKVVKVVKVVRVVGVVLLEGEFQLSTLLHVVS